MVATLARNARRLGLDVQTARADAEALPFADESFDLVLGHAVLHHLPNLRRAFAEFHRVLRPGGRIAVRGRAVARRGQDRRAARRRGREPGRPGLAAADRRRPGATRRLLQDRPTHLDHELERCVDIHAFAPGDLERHARRAGLRDIVVRGEELTASWFGWFNRGLEASADPASVPMLWRQYAFHGYLLLQRLDEQVLEPRLPPAIFYNLLLTARRS